MKIGTIATAALGLAIATIILPLALDVVVTLAVFGLGYAVGKGMFDRPSDA